MLLPKKPTTDNPMETHSAAQAFLIVTSTKWGELLLGCCMIGWLCALAFGDYSIYPPRLYQAHKDVMPISGWLIAFTSLGGYKIWAALFGTRRERANACCVGTCFWLFLFKIFYNAALIVPAFFLTGIFSLFSFHAFGRNAYIARLEASEKRKKRCET